jgi:hypothetical protein
MSSKNISNGTNEMTIYVTHAFFLRTVTVTAPDWLVKRMTPRIRLLTVQGYFPFFNPALEPDQPSIRRVSASHFSGVEWPECEANRLHLVLRLRICGTLAYIPCYISLAYRFSTEESYVTFPSHDIVISI